MPREITNETPSKRITIAGYDFSVFIPYAEGDELNTNEANALNQTRCENIRNNMASVIEEEKKKAAEEGREPDVVLLQKLVTEYDAGSEDQDGYQFGIRTGGGRTGDPVEAEMMENAREIVRKALRAKGHILKNVGAAEITKLAREACAKYPQLRAQAEATVAARQKAIGDIDFSL